MPDIELTLAEQDAAELSRFFAASGRTMATGLAGLLFDGVTAYETDQRTWEELSAACVPDDDPARQELQRREAHAHLFSMRPRTFATEAEMNRLRVQVLETSAAYKEFRNRLRVLQRRQEHLRNLIDGVPSRQAIAVRRAWWQRLLDRFTGARP